MKIEPRKATYLEAGRKPRKPDFIGDYSHCSLSSLAVKSPGNPMVELAPPKGTK